MASSLSSQLEVEDTNLYTKVKQLKIIGHFSQDCTGKFRDDNSQVKYYSPPFNHSICSFDLYKGYKETIPKNKREPAIYNLFRWILCHKDDFQRQNTDFVTNRGLLSHIMCNAHFKTMKRTVGVIRLGRIYYMKEFDTHEPDDEVRKWMQCDLKFTQYLTADTEGGLPDTDKPVNSDEHYNNVLSSFIGSHSLVYNAVTDCKDNGNYMEIKTCKKEMPPERFHRNKLMSFWSQGIMAGLEKTVCGFRDRDNGKVEYLEEFVVRDIPRRVATFFSDNKASLPTWSRWKESVCFDFLEKFLRLVKSTTPDDGRMHIFLCEGNKLSYKGHLEDYDYFLPDWYLQGMHSDA